MNFDDDYVAPPMEQGGRESDARGSCGRSPAKASPERVVVA